MLGKTHSTAKLAFDMSDEQEKKTENEPKAPEKPRTIPGRSKEHYDHTEDQPISPPLYRGINI